VAFKFFDKHLSTTILSFLSYSTQELNSILNLKGILSILDQNLDHGDSVYIWMKLKEWRVLNGHAVMF